MPLSDSEREHVKKLIDAGEPLLERYRSELFAEPQGVELIWPGKTQEVTTAVLPFQSIEQIDEPRSEAGTKGTSMDLFSLAPGGRQHSGWTNKLIWGDNKLVLSSLANGPLRRQIEDAGGLKLVYIDPPFDVGADFSLNIEIGDEAFTKEPNLIEELAYRDTWGRGADSYLAMIYERLRIMSDLLSPAGSLYVHVGGQVSHTVRVLLEEMFGADNYINEVIWKRQSAHNDTRQGADHFGRIHDTIHYVTKGKNYTLNMLYEPYSQETIDSAYRNIEEGTGRRYSLGDITAPGGARPKKGNPYYEFLGITRYWRFSREKMQEMYDAGRIIQTGPGRVPVQKRYLDEMPGVALQDLWLGISPVTFQSSQRVDYDTQKPEALLERIVQASSNQGDLVADFFCGSGTTLAVAEKLGRKWIGCDLGRFAIHTTRKRLIGVQRELKAADKPYRAFEILNLGKYERQYFSGINPNLGEDEKRELAVRKEEQYIELILTAYKAERVWQSPPFHGKHRDSMVLVGPVDAPVTQSLLHEAVAGARKLRVTKVDILGFDFEMGLVPYEIEKAQAQGVSIQPKYIPRDVFDKRAVEKGQVKFYDVAYVEVKAHVDGKRVRVELTDFGVHYRQDDNEDKLAKIKPGASKVIVKNGQVVKVTRAGGRASLRANLEDEGQGKSGARGGAPSGEFTEEILTKQWSDWIDYWAVDFDYFTRPEQVRVLEKGVERSVYTGNYLFENEWQSFRTRKERKLELESAWHEYDLGGLKRSKKTIAVKVIDIFGNDTTKAVEVMIDAAR